MSAPGTVFGMWTPDAVDSPALDRLPWSVAPSRSPETRVREAASVVKDAWCDSRD